MAVCNSIFFLFILYKYLLKDIDEIVLGKTSNNNHEQQSEWKQCFDETTQAIYYWNTKTNECSWDPPPPPPLPSITSENYLTEKSITTNVDEINSQFDLFWLLLIIYYFLEKKRPQSTIDNKLPKKIKKPSLIAEYASSESESSEEAEEENVDDIDELLNEVLDKEEKIDKKIDLYPLFEADCRAAIARLTDLGDKTTEIFTLRIQLEVQRIFNFYNKLYSLLI